MTAACLPFPLAAIAAVPADGAPARSEPAPQAAEEFSALISLLIPEAAPERTPEKPLALPFPVQAFVPPVEVQAAAPGGVSTLEAEAATATSSATVAAWPTTGDPCIAPTARPVGAGHARPAPGGEVDMPQEAVPPSPDPAPGPVSEGMPAAPEEDDEPAEAAAPALESAPPLPDVPAPAPAPASAPAPIPAPIPAPAPQATTSPVQPQPAPRRNASPEAPRRSEKIEVEKERAPVETEPEISVAPARSKEPAPEAELAFAARLTELTEAAPATASPKMDAARAAPADPAPLGPSPAPQQAAEAPPEAPANGLIRPVSDSVRANRPEEPEKPDATPKPSAGAHIEPAAPQPAPVQPARTPAQPAAPERTSAPTPIVRADFEPVRVETPPQPLRELSVQVPRQGPDDARPQPVEVRVLERAGQVHVAVRSSDPQLNRSLGEGLHELVTNLENRGYAAETWRPQSSGGAQSTLAAAADGPVQQGNQTGSGYESSQESGRGHHGGAGDQSSRQQRRGQDEARPQWLEMLEGAVRQRNSNTMRSNFA